MDLKMLLAVLMEFAYRLLDITGLHNRFNGTLQFKQMMNLTVLVKIVRFFVICLRGGKFLRSLNGS